MTQKVALITGASAGLGRACADTLDQRGWQVVGTSRRGLAGSWTGLVMDVDDDEAVRRGVDGVVATHGRLDAVVAAAGWGLAGPVEETPIADAKAQIETNLWGVVRVVQAALPHFRRQGGGRVIVIGSIGGVIGIPFQAFYSASKFALEGYVEALAYEVAPFNVQVCVVEPGNFKTNFTAARRDVDLTADSPYRAATAKAIGRMARDEQRGADPRLVGELVARLLEVKRMPRRVTAGKVDERAGALAKRLLPFSIFERAAKSSLGV
jgi:NAD(P)-dependent dehydrogenase (short-subunit alcohol dehydrogenase family)